MPVVRIDLDDAIPAHRRDDIFATVTQNTVENWYAGVDAAAQP
jgi:hypothetical protein